MDASPIAEATREPRSRIESNPDGRLKANFGAKQPTAGRPFSGVLEFLKALEETLDAHEDVAPS